MEETKGGSDEDDDVRDKLTRMEDTGVILKKRTRNRKTEEERRKEEFISTARATKQLEIMEKRVEIEKKRLKKYRGEGGENEEDEENDDEVENHIPNLFKTTNNYPPDLPRHSLYVDLAHECVFVPINGSPVPIHISLIKTISCPDPDDGSHFIRLNFYTPLQSIGKDASRGVSELAARHSRANKGWIKELCFKSTNQGHIQTVFRKLQQLKKALRSMEKQAQMEEDLIEQPPLEMLRGGAVPRLRDILMKPFLSGRKSSGQLEIHSNGLRFTSSKGEHFHLIYANIKNAIYAPCKESDERVLFHFSFKTPLMIGKKKSYTCQFFAQIVEASTQISGSSRSMHDPDELDEEQRERRLKKKLNDMFKEFGKKIQRISETHSETVRGGSAIKFFLGC